MDSLKHFFCKLEGINLQTEKIGNSSLGLDGSCENIGRKKNKEKNNKKVFLIIKCKIIN